MFTFTWWVQVADFGLSKEEVHDGRKSGLKGTYGYMDPDYMSTNKFTKKSDVYSFGIILFELITGINPQQGLMEYINLVSHLTYYIDILIEITLLSFQGINIYTQSYHNLEL
jgi:serine/threonine protein kinase